MILRKDITAGTADTYGWRWEALTVFCDDDSRQSLQASPGAVACYFKTLAEGNLNSSAIREYLTPIKSRHAAAGLDKPAVEPVLARLHNGYARVRVENSDALPFARGPLPAPMLRQIVLLGLQKEDPEWHRRFTAVVTAFLVSRRTSKVLEL